MFDEREALAGAIAAGLVHRAWSARADREGAIRRVIVVLDVVYAVALLAQLPYSELAMNVALNPIPPLLFIALCALVGAYLAFRAKRGARVVVLLVALVGSWMFKVLTEIAFPLLFFTDDARHIGVPMALWLTLGMQPLILILALFWTPTSTNRQEDPR